MVDVLREEGLDDVGAVVQHGDAMALDVMGEGQDSCLELSKGCEEIVQIFDYRGYCYI